MRVIGRRENLGVTELGAAASPFSLRTVWSQNLTTPLRERTRYRDSRRQVERHRDTEDDPR
jgi:hypothetical protein